MNDVLTVALERQRELRDEISEIDEFIRLAESLLRNATIRPDSGPGPQPRERPEPRLDRPEPALATVPAAGSAKDGPAKEGPGEQHDSAARPRPAAAPKPEPVVAARPEPAVAARPEPAAGPAKDTGIRKFPWTGVQPAVRRTGNDEPAGPTRRNVFRRDLTAAG